MTKMIEDAGFDIMHLSSIGRIRSIDIIIKKIGTYSKSVSKVFEKITPTAVKNISISINPLDEMHIIARKR